jgi:hypothetical protein
MLSIKLHTTLFCPSIDGFPNLIHVKTNKVEYPKIFDLRIHDGNVFECLKKMEELRGKVILVNGHFENHDFVKDIKSQLVESFGLDRIKLTQFPEGSNNMGIHVRLGDISNNKIAWHRPSPMKYFTNIIDNTYDNLYCLTDSPDHSMIEELKELYPRMRIIHNDTPSMDMSFLSQCDNIIMSQSTFAWWAAFLSNAKTIHFPIQGHWQKYSHKSNKKYSMRIGNDSRVFYHETESDLPKIEYLRVSCARVTSKYICLFIIFCFFLIMIFCKLKHLNSL